MGEFQAKIKLVNDLRTTAQSVNTLKVKLNKIERSEIEPTEVSMIEELKIESSSVTIPVETTQIEESEELIEVNLNDNFKPFQLIIGSRVKHKEEGIVGEIKFIGNEKIAIVWEDNTRERMSLDEAKNNLEYINDIQTLVAPTTSQMSYNPGVNDLLDKAIATLEDDEVIDDIIEVGTVEGKVIAGDTETIDIEKIKLQRKVNDLNNQLMNKITNSMKEKIANEIVSLAIDKGIIDADEMDIEIQKVLSFNDDEFENYKTSILDYETDGSVVTSTFAPVQPQMTEAERMLARIKGNGGKGIVGDFSKEMSVHASEVPRTITNTASSSSEKRSLGDLKDEKFTFAKVNEKIPIFEEQFESILTNKLENVQQRKIEAKQIEQPKELPGFENLQGLKKPIRVPEKAASYPTNTSIQELFGELGWTTISKVH